MGSSAFSIAWGLVVWVAVFVLVILVQRTHSTLGVGLVLAYFLNLGLIHLPGAILYINPDYQFYNRTWIQLGFEQSTYAIAAFGVGAVGCTWLLRQSNHFSQVQGPVPASPIRFNPWLHRFYVVMGLVSYLVISPLASEIPTLSAIVAVMNQLTLLGICLGMWNAWQTRRTRALIFWILALGSLPVLTIVVQGFISFGTVALLTGLAFLASFFRPRWLVALFGILFIFVGLSAFVTYFRDRTEIRRIVWGGESIQERVGQLGETFGEFEWFDPNNRRHANYLDDRLNQNWLVGAAVERVIEGKSDLKYGATFFDALISIVPRAIWPDKPVRAGSGNLVADATGVPFAAGTSVGVGQVLEFYINFGTPAVVLGAFLWGVALAILDVWAAAALQSGESRPFTMLYLVGLGFMLAGGSLVEIVATTAAAAVTALLINDFLVPFFVGAAEEPTAPEPSPPHAPPARSAH